MKISGFNRKRYPLKLGVMTLLIFSFLSMGAAFASGGGGHEAEAKGWVATDTYKVMNFAVLAVGLFLILRKPVAKALDARIVGIRNQLEELEAQKKAAEAELVGYDKKLKELDQEAARIKEEYIKQGNDAKVRILKEAESTAEKLEIQAKKNIENEFEKVRSELKEEVIRKALEKAEALITKKITEDDQDRLVDEYLKKVVA